MKILQLISSTGFYGAESMLVNLSRALAQSGCEVTVGVLEDTRNPTPEIAEVARQNGLPVSPISFRGRWDWAAVRRLRRQIADSGVQVLHSHGYKADLCGFLACRKRSVARVSTCHNWPDPKLQMQFYARLDRLVLRGFDAVTTPSPLVMEILERSGIASSKLTFIGNGVDLARFGQAEPSLRRELQCGDRPIIGFVGRCVNAKGGEVLIDAASHVLAGRKDALFVFVGDGPCRAQWRERAESLGLGSQVIFTGTRTDLPQIYASMNVFVLPSFDEAMPMSVLEAMAAARPVIATPVGAVPKLVLPGETGFLCEAGNARELARTMIELLDQPALQARLGANGHALVARGYSSSEMARQYLRIYRQAAGCPAAAPEAFLSELR